LILSVDSQQKVATALARHQKEKENADITKESRLSIFSAREGCQKQYR